MRSFSTLALSLALAAAGLAQAGTVEVSVPPGTIFTDAGNRPSQEQDNLRVLSEHLQGLGQRLLPAGQTLTVELLDVDLAGDVRPRRGQDLRIARGGADWPKLTLRYSLLTDGKVVQSGEESISDMDYLNHLPRGRDSEPLSHEKRLLTQWFASHFAASAR